MSRSSSLSIPGLDVFKALASQLIVLHHLSLYGPLPDMAWSLAPELFGWFANHARVAVQVFIVMAGFLAAHTLAPDGRLRVASSLPVLARRYLRIVLPFLAALVLTTLCAGIARGVLDDALVPAPATAGQFLAHAMLLHGVFGVDALSAGAWYVAIDLQLFMLFLGLMRVGVWLGERLGSRARFGPALVLLVGAAGMLYFNRDAHWDNFGFYFFGAYSLGVFARWALASRGLRQAFVALLALTGLALCVDFRVRLLVAMLLAPCLLVPIAWSALDTWLTKPRVAALFSYLARVSYSLFLTHFAILLLINTIATEWFPASPALHLAGMLSAWLLANVAAHVFHKCVETPALAWCAQIGRGAGRLAGQQR